MPMSNIMSMSWNEPENNNNQKPGNLPGNGNKKNDPDGPPDLSEIFKSVTNWFGELFGGYSGSGNMNTNNSGSALAITIILAITIVIYALFGFYKVDPPELAVITRFGAYNRIEGPGLHWLPPLIESKRKVNVKQIYNMTQGSLMLTEDVNIVDFKVDVHYRIENPKDFLFNNVTPLESLQEATESTLRQVVGHMTLDRVLLFGQSSGSPDANVNKDTKLVQKDSQEQQILTSIQDILNSYGSGIDLVQVTIKQPKVPASVQEAYDDVTKALENLETNKNEARAYSNKIIEEVKGQVARLLEEARAYKNEKIHLAEGDTARFKSLLVEYNKAPAITRKRLYLETLQKIFENTPKIFLDASSNGKGNNDVIVLPLEKLLNQSSAQVNAKNDSNNSVPPQSMLTYQDNNNRIPSQKSQDAYRKQQIDARYNQE